MPSYDLNQTAKTLYSDLDAHSLDPVKHDSIQNQEETIWTNKRWASDWTAFNSIPKLKSAIIMKAIWTVGKGYNCDEITKIKLDRITGNGKQTFRDVLFSLIVTMHIGGDAYAEIVRDKETDDIINLKILDPSSIRIVYSNSGMIKRYEQMRPQSKGVLGKVKNFFGGDQVFESYDPEEIFHLSRDCYAGEIHGRGVVEAVEKIILADDENFNILRKLTRFQAVPFIVFKVKSDNATTIGNFKANIKDARENGEDLIIPDDDNLLTWEAVQVNPSSILMEWRNSLNNQYYQAIGLPLILFGTAGSTESGGKIEYTAHETVFENSQVYIEEQVLAQLGYQIDLNSPVSLLENLKTDEAKDQENALNYQPNDVIAGVGR